MKYKVNHLSLSAPVTLEQRLNELAAADWEPISVFIEMGSHNTARRYAIVSRYNPYTSSS